MSEVPLYENLKFQPNLCVASPRCLLTRDKLRLLASVVSTVEIGLWAVAKPQRGCSIGLLHRRARKPAHSMYNRLQEKKNGKQWVWANRSTAPQGAAEGQHP